MTSPRPSAPPASPFVRPAVGLFAGLGVTVLIVFVGTLIATLAMLRGVDPKHFQQTSGYLITTLVISTLGAFAGGFTTSRITAGRSFYTVFLLALMLLVSGAIPALKNGPAPGQPIWYPLTLALVAPMGVLIGGLLERRREAAGRAR